MKCVKNIIMDSAEIKKIIPHREPFILIDFVHEITPDTKIVTSKVLRPDEPIFQGHFPGNPIYPGVYYIESIAQSAAVLLFVNSTDTNKYIGLLSSVEQTRFRKPCKPGDHIYFYVSLEKKRQAFFWLYGQAFVDDEMVMEANISVALRPKT